MKDRKLKKTEAIDDKGRLWDKEKIQELLKTNDNALYAALMLIYDRQTHDEQDVKYTKDWNSIGFTGVDAFILSSFVESYKKYNRLTPKQMALAKRKMKKYWKQLLDVIRQKNPNQPERIIV